MAWLWLLQAGNNDVPLEDGLQLPAHEEVASLKAQNMPTALFKLLVIIRDISRHEPVPPEPTEEAGHYSRLSAANAMLA